MSATMPPVEVQYQPLEVPLNEKATAALADLPRSFASDNVLRERLRSASSLLASTVSDINEAKLQRRDKHTRQNERLQSKGEEPNDDDDVKEFEKRVDSVTEKMDLAIRQIVDDRVWFEGLSDVLKHVSSRSADARATQNQPTQRSTQVPTQDATPRRPEVDEDGNEIEAEEPEEDAAPTGPPPAEEVPNALLAAALASQYGRHTSKSLTERYARDNDYAGFYRALHDARYSNRENAPPVPAPALWFAREETGGRVSSTFLTHEGDDTELVVAAERVSTRCPLTATHFVDPVTSDLCHHSYERSAIHDFLKSSDNFMPFTREQQSELAAVDDRQRSRRERQIRVPRAQCPQTGCTQWVTEKVLRDNPVLARQAKRVIEAEERDRQQDDEDGSDTEQRVSGTQRRPFGIGSSPAMRGRLSGMARVKAERASVAASQSQSQRGRGRVLDMSDSGEEE
jgi:E3 SUMO-protein ligase NSE2